jgi:molybdate transport system ATP-binding protein
VVTHDPIEAMALADRIIVLEDGHISQHGTSAEIRAHPRSRYVADLVGINLLRGNLEHGVVTVTGGRQLVIATDETTAGPVIVTIHPRAIALHSDEPHGAARNVWPATVEGLDDEGDRVRVRLAEPTPLVVEITRGGSAALSLHPGARVWASLKASEISVQPD